MAGLPPGIGHESRSPELFQGDDADHLLNSLLQERGVIDHVRRVGGSRVRPVHALGVGFKGTFQPSGGLAGLTDAKELTDQTVVTPVTGRFSNFERLDWEPRPDIRGLAVRFTLHDDQILDLVAMTAPRFIVRRREDFHHLARRGLGLSMVLSRRVTLNGLITLTRFTRPLGPLGHRPRLLQQERYHSVDTFYLVANGEYRAFRYRWRPDDTGRDTEPDLRKALLGRDVRFRLEIDLLKTQAGTARDNRLREDSSRSWRASAIHDPIDAGTLTITPEPDAQKQKAIDDEVEAMAFNPTHLPPGVERSESDILLARAGAYAASHVRRRS